jgi:hypothetical protein
MPVLLSFTLTHTTHTGDAQLPWKLPGVHSARLEMAGQRLPVEEALGLNCAWYAGILLTLTGR